MKKTVLLIMLSFLFNNFSLAESALDYMGKKQSDMDENYECLGHANKKSYISYKKINGKLFKYNYWSDEGIDGTMGSGIQIQLKNLS